MLQILIPRLPARDIEETKNFYVNKLSFSLKSHYNNYLILSKDNVEIHFYYDESLNPAASDRMIYLRVSEKIKALYEEFTKKGVQTVHSGKLETKPWGQTEFSIVDTNGTLLTFGQAETT
jgi:predicted enzyme related to lactoylglutathione lyase